MRPDQEPQDVLGRSNFSSNVKKKVQALLTQLPLLPGYSSMRKSGFIYLLEGDPEGTISCTPHPLEAQDLSFPTSYFAAHLEVIWSVNQKETRSCSLPGSIQRTGLWASIWLTNLTPNSTKLQDMKIHLILYLIKVQKFKKG